MMSAWTDVELVLFDLDGTLLDSAPDLACAANTLREAKQLSALPLANYRPFVGTGARGMLRIALAMEPDHPEFDAYKEHFFRAYEQVLTHQSTLFEGVKPLIDAIEATGMKWGIVTNKSVRFTSVIVQNDPVLSRAAIVVSGDTTPKAKPHPLPLLHACESTKVIPANAIYVGDDERDIQAAHAAGMRAVAADYGYLGGVSDTAAWNPEASIKKPLDLLKLLGVV